MYIPQYVVVNTFIGGRQPQNKVMRLRTFKKDPITSSKQQEKYIKNKVLKTLQNFPVAEADSLCVPAATPCRTPSAPRTVLSKKGKYRHKKEDTDARTAPEAPAMPAPGEAGPGPGAVPSVPLHGPVDVADDSLEGLQSAFTALSVEEVDTNPVKRKREREKDAGEGMADKGVDHGHDPTSESTFEGAPSTSGLEASPSPTTTTLPTPDPAAAKSTPITTPPMAEGTGFTGMPTYPAYGSGPIHHCVSRGNYCQ